MAKIAHVINDRGNVYTRKPWTLEVAATGVQYKGETFFMDHERSPFLEKILGDTPYLEITGHAMGQDEMTSVTNWMIRIAKNGTRTADGREWKFLWGSWTDKGTMIVIPVNSKISSLEDLGVHVKDPNKAPKYLKRAKAPHQYAAFGKVLDIFHEEDGHIVEFQLEDGYIGQLRHINLDSLSPEQKAVADGQGRIKPEFLSHIGVKARNINTYACKGTTMDPIGLGKGYYHAQEGLYFDIVVYGAKKQVSYDNFFFGILGSLKPGTFAYTDLQSMTNFEEWRFAADASKKLFSEIASVVADEEKLSGLFMSRVNEARGAADSATSWSIINAKKAGMSLHAEPSLIRKAAQHWTNEVVNTAKGRIPADHMMRRADIVPDPHMFNRYGDIDLSKTIIPTGHMVCYDVPVGPTVEYRQPNGHALEHSASMNVHLAKLKKFEGMHRCFYGADMLEANRPKNGADNDDTQVIAFEPTMVKAIRALSYPLTQKIEISDAPKSNTGRYFEQLKNRVEDAVSFFSQSVEHFEGAVEAARANTLRLGQVVNNIMLDTLLSGEHKLNMMLYLDGRVQSESDRDAKILYLNHRDWLANREDYQLRDVATNLEAVIDYCIQGKGDASQFRGMIKQVNDVKNNTLVYPFIYGKQGTGFLGQGRIPPSKRLNVDFIYAPSLMCEALGEVESEIKQFNNDMRSFEWECISEVPEDLDMLFGTSQVTRQIAIDIRSDFNALVSSAMSISDSKLRRQAYHEALYGKFHKCTVDCPKGCSKSGLLLEAGLKQMMDDLGDDEERMFVAVELKRITQRNRQRLVDDVTNMVRGVPDGVFGNDVVFNIYLQALEVAGLTGKYVSVEFDQVSEKLKRDTLDVVVENGNVLRKKDHFWIGTVDSDNGEYRLVQGFLEVRKPSKDISDPFYYDEGTEEGGLSNPVDLN